MIIVIFIIILAVLLVTIAVYLHFSKKPDTYDPERIKLERDNEERRAKADFEAKRQSTRNFH